MAHLRRSGSYLLTAALSAMIGIVPLVNVVSAATAPDPNHVEGIPIAILNIGFGFKVLKLPAGFYAFLILNRSGLHDVQVILERMPGNSVDGPALEQEFNDHVNSGGTKRLEKPVHLAPGTYRLSVAGMPNWVSAITVQ